MKGRSFLTLLDYSPEEIRALLNLAARAPKQSEHIDITTMSPPIFAT